MNSNAVPETEMVPGSGMGRGLIKNNRMGKVECK